LLLLGPLTNFAKAIAKFPSIVNNLKRVVIMGGCLAGNGNSSPNSEFNFLGDGIALKTVLDA